MKYKYIVSLFWFSLSIYLGQQGEDAWSAAALILMHLWFFKDE